MRVNIYAEELTDRVDIISKEIEGRTYTGVRFYLELPATVDGKQYVGPFIHHLGDDDSSAVTFWGKSKLRYLLKKAMEQLEVYSYTHPEESTSLVFHEMSDEEARNYIGSVYVMTPNGLIVTKYMASDSSHTLRYFIRGRNIL